MDFQFFESLSRTDAEDFFRQFLSFGTSTMESLGASAAKDGHLCDFRVKSLPEVLEWGFGLIETIPSEPDESLPVWIRECDVQKLYSFTFADTSLQLLARLGFYFGETFVRTFPTLRWSMGNRDYALENMPVVSGFRDGHELPPVLVTANLCGKVIGRKDPKVISRIVKYWTKSV